MAHVKLVETKAAVEQNFEKNFCTDIFFPPYERAIRLLLGSSACVWIMWSWKLKKRKVVCGAEVIRDWRPFKSCYGGRMTRNRGDRGWNVGSEGNDNRKDGRLIN